MAIRRRGLLLVWYLTVFGLAALASTNVVRADEPSVRPDIEITPEAEARRAASEHANLLAAYGGQYADPRLTQYIVAVGDRILQAADGAGEGFAFRFTVLDSPAVFAFSIAGGDVYLSRGMIAVANSEAEIAAVLAHEVSHVVLRHGAERILVVAQQRSVSPQQRTDQLQALTARQEFDADAKSIALLVAAGYDPMAQARFLAAVERTGALDAWLGTGPKAYLDAEHPRIGPRISKVRALAAEYGTGPTADTKYANGGIPAVATSGWFTGRDEFLAAVDGMSFGPKPAEGVTDGQTYVNTSNGYAFQLPAGFQFTSVGRSVTAAGPNGASIRVDTFAARDRIDADLGEHLLASTSAALVLGPIAHGEANGLPVASALATVAAESGPAVVHVAMVQIDDRTVARFQAFLTNPQSQALEEVCQAAKTIRGLSSAEREGLRPLQVEVVSAPEDTLAEAFAAQMRTIDHPLEWFLAINQLQEHQSVLAGQRVKLVTRYPI